MKGDMEGAHVAIVGLGSTQGTFTSSVANGKSFDDSCQFCRIITLFTFNFLGYIAFIIRTKEDSNSGKCTVFPII